MTEFDPAVYLVTDTALCGGPAGVVSTVRAAVRGGVTMVQLRDPAATTRQLAALATSLLEVLRGTGIPLIVNDRVDVALAVGADGAHVGQSDLDPVAARRLLGPAKHLGLSVTTLDELVPPGAVDLLGVGPVRDTPSKADAATALGLDGLARICAAAQLPVVAIGGVKLADVAAVRNAGAAGMAVISAICGQPDPEAATRDLVAAWRSA